METQAVFLRRRALTTSPGDSPAQPASQQSVCDVPWPSKGRVLSWVTHRGQETFASLASDQTPPREERQKLSGSIDLGIDCFSSLAWAEQDPSFLRELAVQGPEAAECVKCPWECLGRLWSHYSRVLSSTRNSAIDFALFSCHQAESRLCSSKSCIRKMSAENLLHLHKLFRGLTGSARPDVAG